MLSDKIISFRLFMKYKMCFPASYRLLLECELYYVFCLPVNALSIAAFIILYRLTFQPNLLNKTYL